MTYIVTLASLAAAVLLSSSVSSAVSSSGPSHDEAGGVFQLVQERDGRRSCWGVVIRLNRLAFRPNILPTQLEIRDDKHDSDLRDSMQWAVDRDGKRLTIQWQPGKGDFGSGNGVRVCIHHSAFRDDVSRRTIVSAGRLGLIFCDRLHSWV